ncbi:restriction endonuclease subunit S [Candidatus Venteria ishoeyi]|uniref:Type-1 restriction enzyme EcoKI specificity protein n=1 Tax=Candidatus Venteria ishoeyi TaxID=1899563 RepID=A0A1H6F5A9_9GAMM|nr:restriction endonuclease subunit S [Candidatus Venteria ishoeyi]SEH04174.1 Type-1 restriction enzyme EcoKI specificity protein [Candidatus Venteria ishoeyi]
MEIVKLKEVVKYRKQFIKIKDDESYKRCRVQLHRRGIKLRDEVFGSEIKTKKQRLCKENDFIVAEMDAKFGGYGIIPKELADAIVSSHYYLYEINLEKLSYKFLEAIIDSGMLQEQIKAVGSTNYSRVSAKEVLEYEIPCPPLEAQKQVVSLYDAAKSNLTILKSELTHQQTLLKKLRQQILQEAIEGKLTADWRAANPDVEPASALLERIATEKAELVKAKKIRKGKKQPPSESFEANVEIPKAWVLSDLDDISIYITDGTHQTPTYTQSGRIFLSAQNVKPFRFIPEKHKYVSEEAYQEYIKNRAVEKGDLLLGRVGAGIGETAVVDIDIECAIYVSLGLVKTFKKHTDSDYLAIVFNSPYGVRYAKGNISSGGGSAGNFNLGRIRSFPIPLPTLQEQRAIVTKVEKLLTLCDQLETQITQNQTHAEALMQAVLREAFS